jgi:ATP-dependent DNA helicase PIF1
VIPRANRAKIVSHTLKSSPRLWDDDIVYLQLHENMRVRTEMDKHPENAALHQQLKDHEQWLLDLGEGNLPTHYANIVEIPPSMCAPSKEDVIDQVFGDLEDNIGNEDYFRTRAILAATNDTVTETNNELVGRLPGEVHAYHSIDTVGEDDDQTMFPTEFLNSLALSGMADHELNLKVGTPVILLRNIDIKGGHCNGTRYLVKALGEYRLILTKMGAKEDDQNRTLILPRIPMKSNDNGQPFVLKRLQFPIKPAFALTINRAQGQSLSLCGILLPRSVWTHGQIYVAFSRCGNPNRIVVWADQEEFTELKLPPGKVYMRNVVYKEVI